MQYITLYHGTDKSGSENILKNGFNECSCLTSDLELAEYYAECAADESEEECVILKLIVEKNNLAVDYPAFEEPISIYRNNFAKSDEDWSAMIESGEIPSPKNSDDFQTSLDITYSVRNKIFILPKMISVQD